MTTVMAIVYLTIGGSLLIGAFVVWLSNKLREGQTFE
jgi:hypothetical protein